MCYHACMQNPSSISPSVQVVCAENPYAAGPVYGFYVHGALPTPHNSQGSFDMDAIAALRAVDVNFTCYELDSEYFETLDYEFPTSFSDIEPKCLTQTETSAGIYELVS